MNRSVAVLGDANLPDTWSGIAYFLSAAGKRSGFLHDGLNLALDGHALRRACWQVMQIISGDRPRGFQYSAGFIDRFGSAAIDECRRAGTEEILSHWQLLPVDRIRRACGAPASFYIDTTLQALFETQGMLDYLNRDVVQRALALERDGYLQAARVVTMASWVKRSLVEDYGIPSDRVFTVLPGANLTEDVLPSHLCEPQHREPKHRAARKFTKEAPLRLGFTAKDWQRKGLARLVSAAELLVRMGMPAEVLVIGPCPSQFRSHPQVRAAGFIDKRSQIERFLQLLISCDLGCCPSYEEPMGIAPLEYLRLGIPVLCSRVGGLKDVCMAADGACIAVDRDATPAQIAEEIAAAFSQDGYQRLRAEAWIRKEHFSWERTVRELKDVWSGAAPARELSITMASV